MARPDVAYARSGDVAIAYPELAREWAPEVADDPSDVLAREVLVSRTVKDLVGGSGLRFEPRGEHHLKGIEDPGQLFALVDA